MPLLLPTKTTSSHQGMVIMACNRKVGQNQKTDASPTVWHSKKIQKVAANTLSAEAMSLAGAVDVLSWIRLYWGWLRDFNLPWRQADQTLLKSAKTTSSICSVGASWRGWRAHAISKGSWQAENIARILQCNNHNRLQTPFWFNQPNSSTRVQWVQDPAASQTHQRTCSEWHPH